MFVSSPLHFNPPPQQYTFRDVHPPFIFNSFLFTTNIILNSLHLKMFPLHFYHHPQQFNSQQHSASNSFRTSDLEVMRPAFSH